MEADAHTAGNAATISSWDDTTDRDQTPLDSTGPLPTGSFLPWGRINSLVDLADAELTWSITDFTPDSSTDPGMFINANSGVIKAGQLFLIAGAVNSASDGMALVLSGRRTEFEGTVDSRPFCITFVEDLTDFSRILPRRLTVCEAVEFYMTLCVPSNAGDSLIFELAAKDCLKAFDLEDVAGVRCAHLNVTQSKMLYLMSVLMNPLPIVILQNPDRYLEDDQCLLLAKRLLLLATAGHSILICSSQVSPIFLDICSYMYVFHETGALVYGGTPKGLTSYLMSQNIKLNVYSSLTETVCQAVSLDMAVLKGMKKSVEKLPTPPTLENRQPPWEGKASPFLGHLTRVFQIMLREPGVFFSRVLTGVLVAVLCYFTVRVGDELASLYSIVLLDIVLTMLAVGGLIFGYIEGRTVDLLLIEESHFLGRFCKPVTLLLVRIITRFIIELGTNVVLALLILLTCNAFSFLPSIACVILLPTCALLYSFMGAFCALFDNAAGVVLPVLFLLSMWSVMLALFPTFEINLVLTTKWRYTSPLYLIKVLILTFAPPLHKMDLTSIKKYENIESFMAIVYFRSQSAEYVIWSCVALIGQFVLIAGLYLITLRFMLRPL